MKVWTVLRSRDEGWDLLTVTGDMLAAEKVCTENAAPWRPFMAPQSRLPTLVWRRTHLEEDAHDPEEWSTSSWYADSGGSTYCITEWKVQ